MDLATVFKRYLILVLTIYTTLGMKGLEPFWLVLESNVQPNRCPLSTQERTYPIWSIWVFASRAGECRSYTHTSYFLFSTFCLQTVFESTSELNHLSFLLPTANRLLQGLHSVRISCFMTRSQRSPSCTNGISAHSNHFMIHDEVFCCLDGPWIRKCSVHAEDLAPETPFQVRTLLHYQTTFSLVRACSWLLGSS